MVSLFASKGVYRYNYSPLEEANHILISGRSGVILIVEYGRTEVTIYLEPDTEFSADFFSSQGFQEVIRRVKAGGKTTTVRTVKLVVAGALVLTIPLTALSGRASKESYAMSYVYFGTPAEQIRNVAPCGQYAGYGVAQLF